MVERISRRIPVKGSGAVHAPQLRALLDGALLHGLSEELED
jgi:hypothetical protein